jgi:GT2 family glycosyltransferase
MIDASELTVVIPTRDRWEILARTLAGLDGQTARGFDTVLAVDGENQRIPGRITSFPGVRILAGEQAGPAAARNRGAGATDRPLLLFLGDDMVPAPELIARHLDRHRREPAPEVAVLGHVEWHPEVAGDRLARWLEWSGSQFEYRALGADRPQDAGFGRFYASNVSLKRTALADAGGFDPAFRTADYEDLDLGWRLHQRGMCLRYEPQALVHHLHHYDWEGIERRYANRARAERLMLAKHDWFAPWFHDQIRAYAAQPAVSGVWPVLVDRVPEWARPLRAWVQDRANRWYHQRLAPVFLSAWEESSPPA